MGVQVVMLSGDNQATAKRIADQLGIDAVISEVLPQDKAAKIADLQTQGRKAAMVDVGLEPDRRRQRADAQTPQTACTPGSRLLLLPDSLRLPASTTKWGLMMRSQCAVCR